MLSIKLILLGMSGCLAQVSFPGVCPTPETVSDFSVPRYTGVWYEASRYFSDHEVGGKCVKAEYTLAENGTVLVKNSQISSETGIPSSIEGTAVSTESAEIAKLTVTFWFGSTKREASYWVLDTNYDDWALVWSCRNMNNASLRFVWILTREQNPSAEVLEQAYQAVDRNNIAREHFTMTDQSNCTTL